MRIKYFVKNGDICKNDGQGGGRHSGVQRSTYVCAGTVQVSRPELAGLILKAGLRLYFNDAAENIPEVPLPRWLGP